MIDHVKIHESGYGGSPFNFHVTKSGDELLVDLTCPPKVGEENGAGQCRYVVFDQESVRASDGIRLHYDYDRDGYVVEQPKHRLVKIEGKSYDTVTDWIEVGFFGAWKFEDGDESFSTAADFELADQEYAARAKV
jgi:hypothetical protein